MKRVTYILRCGFIEKAFSLWYIKSVIKSLKNYEKIGGEIQ